MTIVYRLFVLVFMLAGLVAGIWCLALAFAEPTNEAFEGRLLASLITLTAAWLWYRVLRATFKAPRHQDEPSQPPQQ